MIKYTTALALAFSMLAGCGGRATVDDTPKGQEGVGQPCTPTDESNALFGGFGLSELNIESSTPQCLTELCIINHFQGRVSCPLGQAQSEGSCKLPGSGEPVQAEVCGQCANRNAELAVYCSCKCDPAEGQPPGSSYCDCPAAFECIELAPYLGFDTDITGKYCIKQGSAYDFNETDCGLVEGFWGANWLAGSVLWPTRS